jgi:hypothetical protein
MPRDSAPPTYRVDIETKDQERALLDGGCAPPRYKEDDPTVAGTTTLAIGEGKGTCWASGK